MPVDILTSPVKVTAVAKLISVSVVVISPAKLLVPVPFWVKPPTAVMSPAAAVVNTPELVTSTLPSLATAALIVKAAPVKSRLLLRVVTSFSVVVPEPACWVRLTASTAPDNITLFAATTVNASRLSVAPTAPVILMF